MACTQFLSFRNFIHDGIVVLQQAPPLFQVVRFQNLLTSFLNGQLRGIQLPTVHYGMEKRGSRYLRYALYTATKYVCYWNPVFTEYLTKKQAEGKHYNVALSHATKKLVRLIYALQKSGKAYLAVT